MATSTLKTRIKHKIDTASNWANSNLVPLEGELVIYKGDKPQIKVGDGSTAVGSLPFIKAGSDITVTQVIASGTKIASIEIDGVLNNLYAPSYSFSTGSANGTIAINGTNVAVKGLGSAAYTNAEYYVRILSTDGDLSAHWDGYILHYSNSVTTDTPSAIVGGNQGTILQALPGSYYNAQFCIGFGSYYPAMRLCNHDTGVWGAWSKIYAGYADSAAKLATARTISLTGSITGSGSFDGSGNLSIATTTNHTHTSLPDGTTVSGHLRVGNNVNGDTNYIAFYGTSGDQPENYNHTYIGENLYGTSEASELIIFKGNDVGNGPTVPSEPGPERIRHIAATHLFQSYTTALSGSFVEICDSTVPINIMGIDSAGVYVYKNLTVNGTLTGNASSASKLATARTISLTGSVTGSGSFDGSGNLSIATTTNHTHSYLPLSGGTMGNAAKICWPDTGNWGNSNSGVTFPIHRGGLYWVGQSDWIDLFAEETTSDMLNLVAQFGDDSSSALIIRGADGANKITLSANGGTITASTVYGAVWNDYAEFRQTVPHAKPGQIVIENGDGTQRITTERLQRGCNVVSDTFGFAIGETDECKTPIACAGRALVYTYENRYDFQPGEAVCSGPNGTVSRMTREEMINNPDCIVGFVSEIPEYEVWGTGNIEVDGRIWIKVK